MIPQLQNVLFSSKKLKYRKFASVFSPLFILWTLNNLVVQLVGFTMYNECELLIRYWLRGS
jgi:hypothetical protein